MRTYQQALAYMNDALAKEPKDACTAAGLFKAALREYVDLLDGRQPKEKFLLPDMLPKGPPLNHPFLVETMRAEGRSLKVIDETRLKETVADCATDPILCATFRGSSWI